MVGMMGGTKEALAGLEAHRLFDMINVFRNALGWSPLPSGQILEAISQICRAFDVHGDETVQKIASEVGNRIEGKR